MLICFAKDSFFVSFLSLSGGSKLELEAHLNSSKELKPVLDRLASSLVSRLIGGSSPMALLTELGKLPPLMSADVVVNQCCEAT
jgi:hypothetical protein